MWFARIQAMALCSSRRSAGSALAVPLMLALLAGCSSGRSATPTTTTIPRPTTTTAPTTTTVAVPPGPLPTPDAAATAFITDWKKHNQAAAASVATQTAIAALFATPYTNQTAIYRGCSMEFLPRVCSFGAYGGGPSSAPLFQIDVTPVGAGWYVSGALVEA